jgi:hypothetical protein|tara:strand:- start:1854 stop:2069 length:216 start_codon:yes stop_codon:yes gene_type:complete
MPSSSQLVAKCSIESVDGLTVDDVKVYRESNGCRYIGSDGSSYKMAKILRASIFVEAQFLTADYFNNCPEG